MAAQTHKYYCHYCRRYLIDGSVAALSKRVNGHNNDMHPADYANWTPETILLSAHYVSPSTGDETMAPIVKAAEGWGRKPPEPKITDADRAFLAKGGVRWD